MYVRVKRERGGGREKGKEEGREGGKERKGGGGLSV